MKKYILTMMYWFVQLTWGIVQTAAGFVLCLRNRKQPHFFYRGAVVTMWDLPTSLSMGLFLFISKEAAKTRQAELLQHEYGHTIQSVILGPLYLLVIGLPSFLWCNLPYFKRLRVEKNLSYYSFFIEKNANDLGKKD